MAGFAFGYTLDLKDVDYTVRMAVAKNDELFITYRSKSYNRIYFAVWSKAFETFLVHKRLEPKMSVIHPPYIVADKQGDLGAFILYYGVNSGDGRLFQYDAPYEDEKGGLTLTRVSRTGTIEWERVYKKHFIGHPDISPQYYDNESYRKVGLQPITFSQYKNRIYITTIFKNAIAGGDSDNIHRNVLAIDPETGDILFDVSYNPRITDTFGSEEAYYLSHIEPSPFSNELIITGVPKLVGRERKLWWCRFTDQDTSFEIVPQGAGALTKPNVIGNSGNYVPKDWYCLKPVYLPDGDIIFSIAPTDDNYEYEQGMIFRLNVNSPTESRWGFEHFANLTEDVTEDPLELEEHERVSAIPEMLLLNNEQDKLILGSCNKNKRIPQYTPEGAFNFNEWEEPFAHSTLAQITMAITPENTTSSPTAEGQANQGVRSVVELVTGTTTEGIKLNNTAIVLSSNMGLLANGDPIFLIPHGSRDRTVNNTVIGGEWTKYNDDGTPFIQVIEPDYVDFGGIDEIHYYHECLQAYCPSNRRYDPYSIDCPYISKVINLSGQNAVFIAEVDYNIYTNKPPQLYVGGLMMKVPGETTYVSVLTDQSEIDQAAYVKDGVIQNVGIGIDRVAYKQIKIERKLSPESPFEEIYVMSGKSKQQGSITWDVFLEVGPITLGEEIEFVVFGSTFNRRSKSIQHVIVKNIVLTSFLSTDYEGIWTVLENGRNYLYTQYDTSGDYRWTATLIDPVIMGRNAWIAADLRNKPPGSDDEPDWSGNISIEENLGLLFYTPEEKSDEGFTIATVIPECPVHVFEHVRNFMPATPVGQEGFCTVTVRNDNNYPLEIGTIEITIGSDVFEYIGLDNWRRKWPIDVTIPLLIKFIPTEVKTYEGALTITNACNTNVQTTFYFQCEGIDSYNDDLIEGDSTYFSEDDIPDMYIPDPLEEDTLIEITKNQLEKAGITRKKPTRTARF